MEVKSLKDLVQQLGRAFDKDPVDIVFVRKLLESYTSNADDWKKYAIFDEHRYTRNLVDKGNGKYNLLTLCWGPGQGSAVHDHADSHCFMKILDGELIETRFEYPDACKASSSCDEQRELQPISMSTLEKNSVAYINDSLGLHRVENASQTMGAVSLHLYMPPFDTCHMFDQKTGNKTPVKITFWTENGQRVSHLAAPPSCVEGNEDPKSSCQRQKA